MYVQSLLSIMSVKIDWKMPALRICLLILRTIVSSPPLDRGHYPADNLQFAPRHLLVNGSREAVIVNIWEERSHLRPLYRGRRCSLAILPTSCLLLLLWGDVEVHPGSRSRIHRLSLASAARTEQHEVRCFSLNARSVMKKLLDLQVYLQNKSLDVLAIFEIF